ncbi:StlD/DarB family beta-ketosynthase [Gordonia sp. (in: high G+C Gram-positive bacteria)]|uniref:StlD/DarB family beta-ketosynthase n=1 Tax=Gordonia sp. (in: high G+C Gram-positive bacteria) TaxID=84139 RepID=UPI00352755D1
MKDVYVTACGADLPNEALRNDEIEEVLGIVKWPSPLRDRILESNRITSRYYAIDPETGECTHSNAELTANAIADLSNDGARLDELQSLVCGTATPDQLMPGHALMAQGELGITGISAISTAGICLSGVAALELAWMQVATGRYDNAVATGSDIYSHMLRAPSMMPEARTREIDPELGLAIGFERDFLRWMLSDGAGALWLADRPREDGLSLRIDWLEIASYAGEMPVCMHRGLKVEGDAMTGWEQVPAAERDRLGVMSIEQNVRLLNKNIVPFCAKPLPGLIDKYGLEADDIDFLLPHYSSGFFAEKSADAFREAGLDIAPEKWFTNLSYKGNTGAASMFIMLDELYHSGRLKHGDTILCMIPESGRFSVGYVHLTVV